MGSCWIVDFVAPSVDHWLAIDVADEGDQALLELLFGADAYVAQHRRRQPGEEALDEALLHGSVIWRRRVEGIEGWAPFLTPDRHRAIQNEPRSPPSHPSSKKIDFTPDYVIDGMPTRKPRFARDSPLEQRGFELPVPP